MQLQRQHSLLSYFKTLSIGPAGVELTTSRMTTRSSANWAIGAHSHQQRDNIWSVNMNEEDQGT